MKTPIWWSFVLVDRAGQPMGGGRCLAPSREAALGLAVTMSGCCSVTGLTPLT